MESNPKPSTSKTEYLGVPNHASQLVINGSHQSIDRQKSETKSHITFSNESIGSNPGSIGSRTGSFNSEKLLMRAKATKEKALQGRPAVICKSLQRKE